jgi:hypothetical protein
MIEVKIGRQSINPAKAKTEISSLQAGPPKRSKDAFPGIFKDCRERAAGSSPFLGPC